MAFPVVPVLLGAAVVGALVLTRKKALNRFVGDKASEGDEVIIPTSAFLEAGGQRPPGLPFDVTSVGIRVDAATLDAISGPIVSVITPGPPGTPGGFLRSQAPTTLGPFMLPRSAVLAVLRNGKALT